MSEKYSGTIMKDNSSQYYNKETDGCFASMVSLTAAMKAQKILAGEMIQSNVVKNQQSDARRGCSYRLIFSCCHERNVRNIFEREGVRIRGWNGELGV